MVKIARLDGAFSETFELKASPVEGQSLRQKDKKRRKRKGGNQIQKTEKPKDVGHCLKSLISADARAKM